MTAPLPFAKECDSKRIQCVTVYKAKSVTGQWRLYTLLFLVAYLLNGIWLVSTIGHPYRRFIEKADREGVQVMQGSTRFRAELEHRVAQLNDPNRRADKIGWTDWINLDVEELVEEKKRDKEKNVLDSLPKHMRVPNKYASDFWPALIMGLLATLHALVLLLQHWSVAFRVLMNYQPVNPAEIILPEWEVEINNEESKNMSHRIPNKQLPAELPTHARIVPSKQGEPQQLVELEYYPTLGMTFEYHRRRYVYNHQADCFAKIRCRVNFNLDILSSWEGFASPERVLAGIIRYGLNRFQVRQPNFVELYKAQLLNPFSVFQIFCVLLWAIDDYLIYSFFSLFMVLMFEGTVVFQRLKSMQALRSMGNPSRLVYTYRSGKWQQVDTDQLLPGDIFSLTRVQPHHHKDKDQKPSLKIEDDGGDIVPADVLLLRGATVVNEASLTGESIPQMKEGLTELEAELDMKNRHKMNVAYAGTKMLQCKGADPSSPSYINVYPHLPEPPDQGCVCFVLRTGFASAQGKLVRMIEGSQEKVKGHEKETGLLLLLLCVFAVISSGYVLYHGAQNENRSKYELLLHCILIITSVIRPELPMQMALAVNNSLMTLMKMHVFCTEPYRVPIAGKLDACLFDKTGTLTTDELVAVGVCEPHQLNKEDSNEELLTHMPKVHKEAALVLAGCHSLLVYEEETTGDPLEMAALSSMRWHLDAATGHAMPAPATEKKPAGLNISLMSGHSISKVEILTRHHFSSKLQRMSCVVKANGQNFAVAKGSPEAIGRLLSSKPPGYDEKAEKLSKEGYRVIGLAFKPLESDNVVARAKEHRSVCESELSFAGFIAFTCMVRKDTAEVLKRLKEGGMSVAMVTGDALLTAIHVAKEVRICEPLDSSEETDEVEETNEELKALLERKRGINGTSKNKKKEVTKRFKPIVYLETDDSGALYWKSYDDGRKVAIYVAKELPALSKEYDLATTGKNLNAAFEQDNETSKVLEYIKVFARMTPDAKETVIECLHSINQLCLMCGDGANDVGALKQADVGVALLSGFGNVNVKKEDDEVKSEGNSNAEVRAIMSKEHLDQLRSQPVRLIKQRIRSLGVDPDKYTELVEKEDLIQLYQIKARELAVKQHDAKNVADKTKMSKEELAADRKRQMQEKQVKMMERVAELEAQGESWAQFKAMREFYQAEMEEAKKKSSSSNGQTRGIEGSAASLVAQFEDLETGELPMVKLGDASIAAPFTSKMPSIRSCVDIVRQGRCTLVSSLQMVCSGWSCLYVIFFSDLPFPSSIKLWRSSA